MEDRKGVEGGGGGYDSTRFATSYHVEFRYLLGGMMDDWMNCSFHRTEPSILFRGHSNS